MLEFCPPGFQGGNARTYVIPLNDPVLSSTLAVIPAAATFQIRQRDTLDFTIDATSWLSANGNALLTTATWVVASGSPHTPVIEGSGHDPTGLCTVVVQPAIGAAVGDLYWLDWTGVTSLTTLPNLPNVSIPARTLTRRIYIMVVAG